MLRLRRFLALPLAKQWLLLETTILLSLIVIALRIVPLRWLQQFTKRPPTYTHIPDRRSQLAWAVRKTSRYIPLATCLPQALVTKLLFARYGYPTELRIGVVKDQDGQLEAHAWVESDGVIVVGSLPDISRYTPLPSLEQKKL